MKTLPCFAVRLLMVLSAAAAWNAGPEAARAEPPRPLATFPLPDWGTSVAFSADGSRLAIGTYEKTILIDLETRKPVGEIKIRSGYVRGLAWSPDGRQLATGGYQSVQLWNADDLSEVRSLKVRGYANDVRFSPDGQLLAAACDDLKVRLWATGDGVEREPFAGFTLPVLGVAFSPDGQWLAAAAGDDTRLSRAGEVKAWAVETGEPVAALDYMPEKGATSVAFTLDGASLLVGDLNRRVTVYDAASGEPRGYFGKHDRQVNSVVSLQGGELAISASGGQAKDKNDVKLWRLSDGEELATLEHHEARITRLAVSADETLLATVSIDKSAALWDLAPILGAGAKDSAADANAPLTGNPAAAALAKAAKLLAQAQATSDLREIRVGIIGLDTSHATAFTKIFNADSPAEPLRGLRVVAAYPQGSPDIESSVSRVPEYTAEVQKHGVEIVDSIEALLERVDCVLLETNDGRPHLEQALPVLKAGKPVFVDKPIAGSLADAVALFDAAKHYGTPMFSSSSLRYTDTVQAARRGELGVVTGCDTYSPAHLEPTHPDLFWYGIHGVEPLFTVMGTGCREVSRRSTPDYDVVTGVWSDGRIGTFRGIRKGGSGYGGTVFTDKAVTPLGPFTGYEPLAVEIAKFFRTREVPIPPEETLEIYAFMAASDESHALNGQAVLIEDVLDRARTDARKTLEGRLTP
ncbi:MAG: Gfo/Idh/MocA family oxidoreductase [Planctomyces sp.]|nr:Gfo/Idh/MocA family oxidoreductase [Planctomyces sp.]